MRLAVVLVAACLGAPAPAELDVDTTRVEVMKLPVGTPIALDVLVVLDNSPAIAPYAARIRTGLDETFEYLGGPGLDLRVGVVTTDSAQLRGVLTSVIGPDGTPHRSFEGSLVDAFDAISDVGTGGSYDTQPLAIAQDALAGFHRDDATLAIVIATDDHAPLAVDAYVHAIGRARVQAIAPDDTPRLTTFADDLFGAVISIHDSDPFARIDPTVRSGRGEPVLRIGDRSAALHGAARRHPDVSLRGSAVLVDPRRSNCPFLLIRSWHSSEARPGRNRACTSSHNAR